MVEITNADELEAWLKDRPREDAVLIAARCALRVFPLLSIAQHQNKRELTASLVLPVIRGVAIACLYGSKPERQQSVGEAARAAKDGMLSVHSEAYRAGDLHNIADAAKAAIDAVFEQADFVKVSIGAAGNSTSALYYFLQDLGTKSSSERPEAANAATFAQISIDARDLESGNTPSIFAPIRLWRPGAPTEIEVHWHKLRDHLLTANEGWEVWTDWYQDRLDGNPANEELEVTKALIPNEIWEAGPATLNAEIARLIAEHGKPSEKDIELPKEIDSVQSNAGERFEGSDDELIDVAEDPLSREIRTDEIAQEFHAEVLDAAEQVLDSCRASNQLGRLADVVDGYLKRLGASPEDVRPTMVGRGERLRFLRDADLRLQQEDDPIPGPMAPDAFARLQNLISAHNQYVATDPKLKEIQDALADPEAQVRATVTPDASQEAIEDIKPVLTDAAVEVLSSATEAAQFNTDSGKRAGVWLSETWRNLSVEMFRRALFQLRQSARALADHVELSAKLTVSDAMEATRAAAEIAWRNSKRGALGMGIIEVTPSVAEAMGSLTHGMDLGGRMFRAAEVVAGTALVPIGGAVGLVVVALLVRLLSKTEWFRNLLDDEQVKKLLPFLKAGG